MFFLYADAFEAVVSVFLFYYCLSFVVGHFYASISYFSCSYYVVHCRFPSVILSSFLGDSLVSFLFIAVLSFAPGIFGCVCLKKKKFVSMSVCVRCV